MPPLNPSDRVKNGEGVSIDRVEGTEVHADRREVGGLIDGPTFDQYKAGSPEAMTAIVQAFQKRLIGFVCLFTRDREVAEEISQEVFLSAYLQREEVYSAEKLRPWLFTLAKRKALKETAHRHYSAEIQMGEEVLDAVSPAVDPPQGEGILTVERRKWLLVALGDLATQERELISLRYFGDLPIKEIADVLHMPMGSVGVKLGRALKRLRAALEKRGFRLDDLIP